MTGRFRRLRLVTVAVSTAAVMVTIGAGSAGAKKVGDIRPVEKVVLFASDGMRPDLMEKYAKAGAMPTYKNLMKDGVDGHERDDSRRSRPTPASAGTRWRPAPIRRSTARRTTRSSAAATRSPTDVVLRARASCRPTRSRMRPSGRARRSPRSTGSAARGREHRRPDRRLRHRSSRPAACSSARSNAVEQAGAAFFGITYQVAAVADASGWTTSRPATRRRPRSRRRGHPVVRSRRRTRPAPTTSTSTTASPAAAYYDHAIVSPVGKTGAAPSVDLAVGDFKRLKLTGADGLIGARAGQTVGHYIKLISLSAGPQQLQALLHLARPRDRDVRHAVRRAAGRRRRRGPAREVHRRQPAAVVGRRLRAARGRRDRRGHVRRAGPRPRAGYSLAVINYILGTLQPDTDLAMVGYPFTDEVSHQFMGLVSPTDTDGAPNPCFDVTPKFDDVQCTGRGTAVASRSARATSAAPTRTPTRSSASPAS